MKFALSKLICLIGLTGFAGYAAAETAATTLTPGQQDQVRTMIQDYMNDPQHLLQMVSNINKAMMDKQFSAIKQAAADNAKDLFFAPDSIIVGNPNGTVTLVEYFDYLCPYCKIAAPNIDKIIAANSNLRVVYKLFPLPSHGEPAVFAAKAALASVQQNKFMQFHQALMAYNGNLTNQAVLDIAKKVGLDVVKLQAAMNSPAVAAQLKNDMTLANTIHLPGTPTLIVANVTPGKTPQDAPTVNKLQMVMEPSPQGLQSAIDGVK